MSLTLSFVAQLVRDTRDASSSSSSSSSSDILHGGACDRLLGALSFAQRVAKLLPFGANASSGTHALLRLLQEIVSGLRGQGDDIAVDCELPSPTDSSYDGKESSWSP